MHTMTKIMRKKWINLRSIPKSMVAKLISAVPKANCEN